MLKPKVYLDTSVISHLLADDTPEKRDDTLKLWTQLKQGQYEVVVSPVVFEEIDKCKTNEEKEALLLALNELTYSYVEETLEMRSLAEEYLKTGVLKEKSTDDCRHIAIASKESCKYILSWNMKHFVKLKTIEMVKEVNERLGYFQPTIWTPNIFIEGDD